MKKVAFFAAVALLFSMVSCKSEYEALLNGNDEDAKYEAAFKYFDLGKYTKSAQLFESLSVVTGGTERDDTVNYYWGLSNYRMKDYYTAETNFLNFITKFPLSPFTKDASYMRLDCLYRSTYRYELDQKPSQLAIAAISEYIASYPDNDNIEECRRMVDELTDRIEKKAYMGARLYYRMEDYLASNVALKNVLKDNSENRYREEILYYTAMSSYKYAFNSVPGKKNERYLVFIDDYYNFIGEYPESQYRKEMDTLYKRCQKALGKYQGDDVDLKLKDKDFAKERKTASGKSEKSESKK